MRGREARLSGGRGAFVPAASSCLGAAWEATAVPGPQPLGPLFAVARVDLVVPSGTWWRGTGPKRPDTKRGWVPGFFPLQQPRVPCQRRAEALHKSRGRIWGARWDPERAGAALESGVVCAVRPAPPLGLAVCVCCWLFYVVAVFFFFVRNKCSGVCKAPGSPEAA